MSSKNDGGRSCDCDSISNAACNIAIITYYILNSFAIASHSFCLFYEVMSGYLRGFGISLAPALLTMLGMCGVRIAWIELVFPQSPSFQTIMTAYPVSLATTAFLILCVVLCYHPARRFKSGSFDAAAVKEN